MYLIPWVTIDEFKEYRVFVHNKKITAVSQQHLYSTNLILCDKTSYEKTAIITKHIDIIKKHFTEEVNQKITLSSYVYDFAILPNDKPYFY